MIKKFITSCALTIGLAASLCTAPKAQAQQWKVTTLLTNAFITTNGTGLAITSNYTSSASIALTKYQEAFVIVRFKLQSGSSTENTTWNWTTSGDATNWATVAGPQKGSFTIPANGTTQVTFATNLYLGSAGYFYLTNAVGATNAATTNIYVEVYTKPARNGS